MKYTAAVTETIYLAKTVEIEAPEGTSEDEVRSLLEAKAYEKRLKESGGWEFAHSDPPEVGEIEKVPAPVAPPVASRIPCVELGFPELFKREDFQKYLNDPDTQIATWHIRGEKPGEYSDVFVTFDNDEGSNSDMPGWDLVCAAMQKLGVKASLVRIVCY